jgi:hypothetical protein
MHPFLQGSSRSTSSIELCKNVSNRA